MSEVIRLLEEEMVALEKQKLVLRSEIKKLEYTIHEKRALFSPIELRRMDIKEEIERLGGRNGIA